MAYKKELLHIAAISFLSSIFIFFFSRLSLETVFFIFLLQVLVLDLISNKSAILFLKIKSCLARVLIGLSALFFALVSFETYLHLARPAFLELDKSILGEFSDFASKGYLDETVFHKDRDELRILGLGDSFAVQSAIEKKNYHNVLQRELQRAAVPRKIKVVNAGMEGIGPGYYQRILQKYGDLIQPDIVLVGFFIGNDFSDMRFDHARYGNFILEPLNSWARAFHYCRFRNFWLWQFFSNEIHYRRKVRVMEDELLAGGPLQEASFPEDLFLQTEYIRSWIFDVKKRKNLKTLLEGQSQVILKMKEFCDKRAVPLIIALLPDEFQVEEDTRARVVKHYGLDLESMDLGYPGRLLLDFCVAHDIYCIDLTGIFQEASKLKRLYLAQNTHWNEAGNELAGRSIADFLIRKELL